MMILGIDPGARTGLALVDDRGDRPSLFWARTCDPDAAAQEIICKIRVAAVDAVVIQVPTAEKLAFFHSRSPASLVKHAFTCGRLLGVVVATAGPGVRVVQAPAQRERDTKWDSARFRAVFAVHGVVGRVSEHARDAAVLALRHGRALP